MVEQRRDVRVHAGAPRGGDRREDRPAAVALHQGRWPKTIIAPHPTTRGIALHGDKVFFAASDAVLVALDARTGEQAWTAKVAENKDGYYMTLAPLVADGKVMVGASGGELGVRGFVAAYDAETGKPLWRTYTVPAPGEPGSETWPKGDQWKNGGAPVWVTGNYDPGHQPVVLGHRQRRAVDGRPAPGRQPLHRLHGGHRRGHRRDQGPLPIPPQRLLGLGRSVAADPRRLPAQRPHGEGAHQRRPQRLPVVPGAQRAARSSSSRASRTCGRTPSAVSTRKPAGPTSIRPASPAPARRPTSARRTGAARTGRRLPSIRRRG